MDSSNLRTEYKKRLPTFKRAEKNIREAIELFLESAEIRPLTVLSRVKSFESFIEKSDKKSYTDPFKQNTDFVGVRIILYFKKDIARVEELIQNEFTVLESEDKSRRFGANEFGYRSHHIIVQIPSEWAKTPNYRGLESVYVEIQLRTILMHAWAEIEHKLQYKSKDQVPQELQRRLFLLCAKVEEADDQFERLVEDVANYRRAIAEKAAQTGKFDTSLEFNLDTFKELVAFFYPDKEPHDEIAAGLYEEAVENGLDLKRIALAAETLKPFQKQLDSEFSKELSGPGYLGYALEIFVPDFWDKEKCSANRNRIIEKIRNASNVLGPQKKGRQAVNLRQKK